MALQRSHLHALTGFQGLLGTGRFLWPHVGLYRGTSKAAGYPVIGPKSVVPYEHAHVLSESIHSNSEPFMVAPPLCLLTLAVL